MGRYTLQLNTNEARVRAVDLINRAPPETFLTFKRNKRSLPQNERMWALLGEIATQVPWHGLKLDSEDWKLIFLDALKRESRIVPNMDGNGFVNLGRSSSDLTKDEMSDLMALIEAFGANHGVTFKDAPAELGKAA